MLGAIIGDIAGSFYEFRAKAEPSFELFREEDTFTDDTVLTIAIADAMMNGKDVAESLRYWGTKYNVGYGPGFRNWLNTPGVPAYNSCGNGSAMRVSSVGWLFNDIDTVLAKASLSAEVTHNHYEGIKGAQCVATIIFLVCTGQLKKEDIKGYVKEKFNYDIPSYDEVKMIGETGHFDLICQETVPFSLACLIESSSYEEVIRKAILSRGDTDTKGAIAGAMAEALFGIPEDIKTKGLAYLPTDVREIYEQFLSLS